MSCIQICVAGVTVTCPEWLPRIGWSLDKDGYVIYTSRRTRFERYPLVAPFLKRGDKMHRVVMRVVAGDKWIPGNHVHHQVDKYVNCPARLMMVPAALHPESCFPCKQRVPF